MQPPVWIDFFAPTLVTGSTNGFALNLAARWVAYSFFVGEAKTLASTRQYVSSIAGTLAQTDLSCSLQLSNAAADPDGTSIETVTCATSLASAGWKMFTGFTTVLTPGQQYWLVFKNLNADPATNNLTFRDVAIQPHTFAATTGEHGVWRKTSTDSGSTWSTVARATFRVGFSDGSFAGIPAESVSTTGTANGIFGTREQGLYFVAPANVKLNVCGVAVLMSATSGSPTGTPVVKLYTVNPGDDPPSPSLVKTSATYSPVMGTGNNYIIFPFDTPVALTPGQAYLIGVGETTNSDASTVRYNLRLYTFDTDADSLALLPLGSGKVSYYDGTSWGAYSAGLMFSAALLLEPGSEFVAA